MLQETKLYFCIEHTFKAMNLKTTKGCSQPDGSLWFVFKLLYFSFPTEYYYGDTAQQSNPQNQVAHT